MSEETTFQIERACLNILLTNPVMIRQWISNIKSSWMTSQQRKRILEEIRQSFERDGTVLGDTVFADNIKNISTDEDVLKSYLNEWKLIKSMNSDDSMESIVNIFNKNDTQNNIKELLMRAQELTLAGKLEGAITLLQQKIVTLNENKASNCELYDFYDYEVREQLIKDKKEHPEKYLGVPSGIGKYDAITGGFFKAELYLISAVTGVGKSTFMKALEFNMVRNGKIVLHVTNEENGMQVLNKFDAVFTDMNYRSFKRATLDDNEIDKWKKTLDWYKDPANGKGRIIVLEIPQQTDASIIERKFFELQLRGINVDAIVIDYLDHMGSIFPTWSENDAAGKASGDLKQLSINCDVPVITATQAATSVEAMQKKGKDAGKMDVYGSKQKTHKVNILMHVRHVGYDTSQLKDNGGKRDTLDQCDRLWNVYIAKNRDGEQFGFGAKHCVESGRIIEYDIENNLAKQEFEEDEKLQELMALMMQNLNEKEEIVENEEPDVIE